MSFPKSTPLQSAPVPGQVLGVDLTAKECTVDIGGAVVDNVTWYGSPPKVAETVYMTDTGNRLIILPETGETGGVHAHDEYLTPAEVKAGANVTVTPNADGTVTISSTDTDTNTWPGAGNGIWSNGNFHVGAGPHIQVDADSVRVKPHCTMITDWNAAIHNGWYMGVDAANSPSGLGGWWYGYTVAHNDAWCHQVAFPFANSFDDDTIMVRSMGNGGWMAWHRQNNYLTSWAGLDNFIWMRHGGAWNSSGPARWAIGNKKGGSSQAASSDDEFRIQRYDTGGTYSGNVMTASTAGVVKFPSGHSRLVEAMGGGVWVTADQAATVGVVADMILNALGSLGLIDPEQRAKADDLFGLKIGEATPEFDPTSVEPPPVTLPDGPIPDALPPEEA